MGREDAEDVVVPLSAPFSRPSLMYVRSFSSHRFPTSPAASTGEDRVRVFRRRQKWFGERGGGVSVTMAATREARRAPERETKRKIKKFVFFFVAVEYLGPAGFLFT